MTGPLVALLACLGGGLGAGVRLLLDSLIRHRIGDRYPLGTMLINLSGSFALGLITGWAGGALLPPTAQVVLGTGLLGGYTTFSTASVETVRLAEERRWLAAAGHGLGQLLAATACAGLGLFLAR